MKQGQSSTEFLVSELTDDELLEVVELFVSELPERIAGIEAALAEQDLSALMRLAHQLKGAAGGYGFPTITDAARQVEHSATNSEDLDLIEREVASLVDLCRRARASARA